MKFDFNKTILIFYYFTYLYLFRKENEKIYLNELHN